MSYAAYRSVRQIRQPKGLMASLALPQELVGAHHLIVAGMRRQDSLSAGWH